MAVGSLVAPNIRFAAVQHPSRGWPEERLKGVTLTDIEAVNDETAEALTAATVYVCITCRRPEDPEDAPRPGLVLAQSVTKAADGTGVTVCQVECLANCSRGLSAAMRCDEVADDPWNRPHNVSVNIIRDGSSAYLEKLTWDLEAGLKMAAARGLV